MKAKVVFIIISIIVILLFYNDCFILYNTNIYYNEENSKLNTNQLWLSEYKINCIWLTDWGLTPNMTVAELEISAQDYLDLYYNGMKTDTLEFRELVKEMFYGDSYHLSAKVKNEPHFGPLYLYACIYYSENLSELVSGKEVPTDYGSPLNSLTYDKTLQQLFKEDFYTYFLKFDSPGLRK